MTEQRYRTLGGVFGAGLVVLAVGISVLLGRPLLDTPTLAVQVALLGLAGVFDVVAATRTRLTEQWAWYRWSGLGSVLLGLSLPLGAVVGDYGLAFVVVTGAGGLSLAAIGVDLVVFHGQYTRGRPLARDGA